MSNRVQNTPRPLVQTARDANVALLINAAQLARMTDGTVSVVDKDVARRACEVALRGVEAAHVTGVDVPQAEARLALALELGASVDAQLKSQGFLRSFVESFKDRGVDLKFDAEWARERTLRAAQEAVLKGALPEALGLRLLNGVFGKEEIAAVAALVGPADLAAHNATGPDKATAIAKAEALGKLTAQLRLYFVSHGDD